MGAILKKDKKTIMGGTVLTSTSPGLGFINPLPTTAANLAGIPAGTPFPMPMTMQQMWDLLLYPYLVPAFTAFSLVGPPGLFECGNLITGNNSFTWTVTNPGNITLNSVDITDLVLGPIETGISAVSPHVTDFTATPIQFDVIGMDTFTIVATDTHATLFGRTYDIYWNWRRYVGDQAAAGNLGGAAIQALAVYNGVNYGCAGTYSFPAAATYKTFAFPALWVQPVSFKDLSTGFNVPMQASYNVPAGGAMDNAFGVSPVGGYSVYRTTNIIGGAIDIVVV